jgi:hypothetical protein
MRKIECVTEGSGNKGLFTQSTNKKNNFENTL